MMRKDTKIVYDEDSDTIRLKAFMTRQFEERLCTWCHCLYEYHFRSDFAPESDFEDRKIVIRTPERSLDDYGFIMNRSYSFNELCILLFENGSRILRIDITERSLRLLLQSYTSEEIEELTQIMPTKDLFQFINDGLVNQ